MRYFSVTCLVAAAVLTPTPAARAEEPASYASPAVDKTLFRDGEVKRLSGAFQNWQYACDDIPRLRQRFCSLFGAGQDSLGRDQVQVVVSTGDDGAPAAMLRLPLATSKAKPIEVALESAAKPAKGKPPAPLRLRVVQCDAQACMTLWKLSPTQIAALNGGGALNVRFATDQGGEGVAARISGAGFADAIGATIKP